MLDTDPAEGVLYPFSWRAAMIGRLFRSRRPGECAHPMLWVGIVTTVVLLAGSLEAQQPQVDVRWAPLGFLLGDWTGEGGGNPGQGTGGFSFQADVQGKIMVRKNFAQYPASKERPAFRHEDLMIVYQDPADQRVRAIYFDNEEHIIRYTVEGFADTVRFVSDILPSSPRYRLTYAKNGADALSVTFEIAPGGKPDAFTAYLQASARRAKGK
jgi:hypothetical protein